MVKSVISRAVPSSLVLVLAVACANQQRTPWEGAPSVSKSTMPRFDTDDVKWHPTVDFPSPKVVDVEFSIDVRGRAKDLTVPFAAPPELVAIATDYVKQRKFEVPKTWGADGSDIKRFTLEIQFSTHCSPQLQPLYVAPRVADAAVVATCVTTSSNSR